jgi:endonuclease YncB( thermonuclease family)
MVKRIPGIIFGLLGYECARLLLKNKRLLKFVIIAGLVILLGICDAAVTLNSVPYGGPEVLSDPATVDTVDTNDESADRSGPYPVIRVVDGDTLILEIAGQEERVRLIGIDAPESVHPDAERNVAYGQIAADFTEFMLEGQSVYLELDVQERDQYGRLLAYVYLDGVMFNRLLLQKGHAMVSTYPPNIKYVEDFMSLQRSAREEDKGIWNPVN